jgi:hypothetical protein
MDQTIAPAETLYVDPGHFSGVYPFDRNADARLRRALRSQYEVDKLEPYNQVMLLHTSVISGRPGYDYSNPYAWIGRLSILKPSLNPNYGGAIEAPESIAANVAATSGLLSKRR